VDKTCALCWHTLADESDPLVRPCDDGSLLFCHRRHKLTARVNGFRDPADVPYQSPFTRQALAGLLPPKDLRI